MCGEVNQVMVSAAAAKLHKMKPLWVQELWFSVYAVLQSVKRICLAL